MATPGAEVRSRMAAVLQAVVPDDEKEQVLNASYTRVEFMNWAAEIPARPTTTTPLGEGSQSEPAEWTDAERASIREATLKDAEEELFMNQYPEASLERYKECANKRELYPKATIENGIRDQRHQYCLDHGLEYVFQMAELVPGKGCSREQQVKDGLPKNHFPRYRDTGFGRVELPKAPKMRRAPNLRHSRDGPLHPKSGGSPAWHLESSSQADESNVRTPVTGHIMTSERNRQLTRSRDLIEAQKNVPTQGLLLKIEEAARERHEEDHQKLVEIRKQSEPDFVDPYPTPPRDTTPPSNGRQLRSATKSPSKRKSESESSPSPKKPRLILHGPKPRKRCNCGQAKLDNMIACGGKACKVRGQGHPVPCVPRAAAPAAGEEQYCRECRPPSQSSRR